MRNVSPPHPRLIANKYSTTILDADWDAQYRRSQLYKEDWGIVKGEIAKPWPTNIKVYGNKMYQGEKLCVPEELLPKIVEAQHVVAGHLGVHRLVEECKRRFVIYTVKKLKELCINTKKYCTTCQQSDPPSWQKRGKITPFPIHHKIWDSVSMVIISMPQEYFEGQTYNCII